MRIDVAGPIGARGFALTQLLSKIVVSPSSALLTHSLMLASPVGLRVKTAEPADEMSGWGTLSFMRCGRDNLGFLLAELFRSAPGRFAGRVLISTGMYRSGQMKCGGLVMLSQIRIAKECHASTTICRVQSGTASRASHAISSPFTVEA